MKKILLFLTAALITTSMLAAPVDQFTAMQKAKSFLTNELYAGKMMSPAALQPVLLKAEMGNVKLNEPVYYIFNTSTTFLVVAGDDRAEEILMIGDRPLRDVNNLPLGLQDMLGQYKDQIMFLQEHPGLRPTSVEAPTPSFNATTYGPLLTCNWDQETPPVQHPLFPATSPPSAIQAMVQRVIPTRHCPQRHLTGPTCWTATLAATRPLRVPQLQR